MKVFTDLKSRGCQDILVAATDGLKGMSEALAAIYPATTLRTCIVHLLRHSLAFANWKERNPLDAFERGPWVVRKNESLFRPEGNLTGRS